MTKKRKQINHAKRRFRERFGLEVSEGDLYKMAKDIREKKAIFVHKDTNRVSIFLVKFRGNEYTVAYDRTRKIIITVLPKDNIELRMEGFLLSPAPQSNSIM